jgi:hypothetical protein
MSAAAWLIQLPYWVAFTDSLRERLSRTAKMVAQRAGLRRRQPAAIYSAATLFSLM